MMKPQRIQLGSRLSPCAPKHSQLLSARLRKELNDALVNLDAVRGTEVVRHIAKLNPEVGGALEHHADRLADIAVLHALKVDVDYSTEEATS